MDLMRSLPLGLYLEQPVTWMHHLDPRVKLAWLMTFLAAPLLASSEWRICLALLPIALTISALIPWRVWKQQMGWLLALCLSVMAMATILPDGLRTRHQPRLPADELAFTQQSAIVQPTHPSSGLSLFSFGKSATPPLPGTERDPAVRQPTRYDYIVLKKGPITITQRSLDVAIRFSTLLFTLVYSTTLFLLTTAPEEITAALENWMAPLRRWQVPVTEVILTLTLSLRFIPLVLEEIQNLVRSISTRAINWQKLGWRRATQIWLIVAERLLENLLLRAEQIASAMKVRGFTSPDTHQVAWHTLRLRTGDGVAIAGLLLLWMARFLWGNPAA